MRKKAYVRSVICIVAILCSLAIYADDDAFSPAIDDDNPVIPAPNNSPNGINKTQIYQPSAPYAPKPETFKSYTKHYVQNNSNYHHLEMFFVSGAANSAPTNNIQVWIDPTIPEQNSYYTNSAGRWYALFGLGAGAVLPFAHHCFTVSLDPAVYFVNFGKIKGIQYPVSNAGTFPTLDYQFSANNITAMLESHLAFTEYAWQPVLIVGVGNAWNHLYNYSEAPTPPDGGSPAAQVFRDRTSTSLAYEAGLSVQRQIYADDRRGIAYNIAIGYRYFYFGENVPLEQSLIQANTTDTLQINRLDAQSILFSLIVTFA